MGVGLHTPRVACVLVVFLTVVLVRSGATTSDPEWGEGANPYELVWGPGRWPDKWYNDPVDQLEGQFKQLAVNARELMYPPIKCSACKCLIHLIYDDYTEKYGDPERATRLEREYGARNIMRYICNVFGPPPFSWVCQDLVGRNWDELRHALGHGDRPAAICNQFSHCYDNGVTGGTTKLINNPGGTPVPEEPTDWSVEALLKARKDQNRLLGHLEEDICDLMEVFKCPVCKCMVDFVYGALEAEIEDSKASELMIYEALSRVCREIQVPPFDMMCVALTEREDVLEVALLDRLPAKTICEKLSMCFGDGVSMGAANWMNACDSKLDEITTQIYQEQKDEKEGCSCPPSEKSEQGSPTAAEGLDVVHKTKSPQTHPTK